MKLTTEELTKIDHILKNLGFHFEDFKLEIKDHIASETEALCENQNLSFQDALVLVLKKWTPNLLYADCLWGFFGTYPKVITKALGRRFFYIHLAPIALLVTLLIFNFKIEDFLTTELFKQMFTILFNGILLTLVVIRFIIFRMKITTSYSYTLKQVSTFMLCLAFFSIVFSKYGIDWRPSFLSEIIIAYFPVMLYCFVKHRQFAKKHQFI